MIKLLLAAVILAASLLAAAFGLKNNAGLPTPPDLTALGDFVIFGSNDVYLEKSTSFSGDIGSNQTLTAAKESAVNGDLVADTVELHKEVTVNGNVSANMLKLQRDESILGETATSVSLPVANLPEIPGFETGKDDVRVSVTTTIPQGRYRDVTLEKGVFATFSGGTYTMETLTAFQDAELLFTATATLFVREKLALHDHVVMAALPSMPLEAIKIFHKGNEPIVVGNRAVLFGTFLAPNTAINAGKEVEMRGRLLAKSVRVDKEGHVSIRETFSSESRPENIVTAPDGARFPVNEIVVNFADAATRLDAEAVAANVSGRIMGVLATVNVYQIAVPAETIEELDAFILKVEASQNSLIESTLRNYLLRLR